VKKSIWAVVAGVLFIIIVTTLVDIVLHLVRVFPPMDQPIDDRLALLATSYRIVISIAGAWLTARLAPDKPMTHAMRLGYVGVVLGLIGLVATWNGGNGSPVVSHRPRRAGDPAVLGRWTDLRSHACDAGLVLTTFNPRTDAFCHGD
jgi:hypothetical protein